MLFRLVTAPIQEPVSLAEAKAHLRIEHALDDDEINRLITAARQYVETTYARGLVTQTWELTARSFDTRALALQRGSLSWLSYIDGFDYSISLPMGVLASITSVSYVDINGVTQVLASTEWEADAVSVPGKLRLAYGKSWPATREQWNAVVIRYVVGTSIALVAKPIKQAILLLVSQLYEHRTPEITGTIISKVQFSVDALLAPYRLVNFG